MTPWTCQDMCWKTFAHLQSCMALQMLMQRSPSQSCGEQGIPAQFLRLDQSGAPEHVHKASRVPSCTLETSIWGVQLLFLPSQVYDSLQVVVCMS